jgi:hypothetical protein
MQQMNKVMDPQKTAKVMQEFEKESTKMEMSEEMSELFHSSKALAKNTSKFMIDGQKFSYPIM